jgi:hypothetical protein
MIIQIRPIAKTSWHGKTGNEKFTRPITIQAFVDPETMSYATGLTAEEEEGYGKKLKVDLSKQFKLGELHPFWDSKMAEIKLENRTQFFNTENPIEFVKIKVMKASRYVANSLQEYEEGKWPEATHVIFDESEEVEAQASVVALKNQAIIESAKLSKSKKVELIMILSADGDYHKAKNLKNKSDNYVQVELDKVIQKNPENVVRFIKMDKVYTSTYAMCLEALQKQVLVKSGHKIMYHDSVIAEDMTSLIDYLNKAENNDFKLRILAMVNE